MRSAVEVSFHTLVAADIIWILFGSDIHFHFLEVYSEPFKTSKMEYFPKIINGV